MNTLNTVTAKPSSARFRLELELTGCEAMPVPCVRSEIVPNWCTLTWIVDTHKQKWRLFTAELRGPKVKKDGTPSVVVASGEWWGSQNMTNEMIMPGFLLELAQYYASQLPACGVAW